MKFKALLVAVAVALSPLSAHAEPTVQQYLQASGELRQQLTIWLTGVENGLMWASIHNEQVGSGKRLYCAPEAYLLTPNQLDQVFRNYLKGSPSGLNTDGKAGMYVLYALQAAFPCPKT